MMLKKEKKKRTKNNINNRYYFSRQVEVERKQRIELSFFSFYFRRCIKVKKREKEMKRGERWREGMGGGESKRCSYRGKSEISL